MFQFYALREKYEARSWKTTGFSVKRRTSKPELAQIEKEVVGIKHTDLSFHDAQIYITKADPDSDSAKGF